VGTREFVDVIIIAVLGFMSVVALAIMINRAFFLHAIDIKAYESLDDLERSLTRYMHLLASIGANSPYIGLLGTVMGIMATFSALSIDGTNISGVMKGLSSALFATGLGLVVAIPSVFMYNVLLRGIKNKMTEWKLSNGRERI
jgi:biopolymer transport protein ExbB